MRSTAFGAPKDRCPGGSRGAFGKVDPTTDIRELPASGTMGGIYVRHEAEPENVEGDVLNYLPIGVEADAPPTRAQLGKAQVTWAAVSLADKLDTIVGLFAAGEKPTGSRDPYGLRRAAQGITKILTDFANLGSEIVSTGLLEMIDEARRPFVELERGAAGDWKRALSEFLAERETHLLERRGFRSDPSCLHRSEVAAQRGSRRSPRRGLSPEVAVLFGRVKNITMISTARH